MNIFVVIAQRVERYDGEYGLEALAVMSEADFEGNPDYILDALSEHKGSGEFAAVEMITLTCDEAAIRRLLFPAKTPIRAEVSA